MAGPKQAAGRSSGMALTQGDNCRNRSQLRLAHVDDSQPGGAVRVFPESGWNRSQVNLTDSVDEVAVWPWTPALGPKRTPMKRARSAPLTSVRRLLPDSVPDLFDLGFKSRTASTEALTPRDVVRSSVRISEEADRAAGPAAQMPAVRAGRQRPDVPKKPRPPHLEPSLGLWRWGYLDRDVYRPSPRLEKASPDVAPYALDNETDRGGEERDAGGRGNAARMTYHRMMCNNVTIPDDTPRPQTRHRSLSWHTARKGARSPSPPAIGVSRRTLPCNVGTPCFKVLQETCRTPFAGACFSSGPLAAALDAAVARVLGTKISEPLQAVVAADRCPAEAYTLMTVPLHPLVVGQSVAAPRRFVLPSQGAESKLGRVCVDGQNFSQNSARRSRSTGARFRQRWR